MKTIFATILITVIGFCAIALPSLSYASSTASQAEVCQGVSVISGNSSNNCRSFSSSGSSIDGVISFGLNLFSGIVGVVAIIMIIIGGVKYVTSGGSSEKTTSAKDTILYSIIGLIIVALAQIIVKFVLHKASAL